MYNLHKYSFISNQTFSSKFFLRIFKQKRGDQYERTERLAIRTLGWRYQH